MHVVFIRMSASICHRLYCRYPGIPAVPRHNADWVMITLSLVGRLLPTLPVGDAKAYRSPTKRSMNAMAARDFEPLDAWRMCRVSLAQMGKEAILPA